jgi:hypothetical protein
MNKRSAMVVAAGLVAALLAGGAALSFSLAGGTAVAQDGGRVKPIVKTERRTVTVHKKAKADPAQIVTVSSPSSGDGSSSSVGDDDFAEEPTETEHENETEDENADEMESADDDSGSGESSGDD